jgi:glutaminyl-tRNA synthetase
VRLHCSHDPASLDPSVEPRKVKGVIHWVSADHGLPCEARLYDRLFTKADPSDVPEGADYKQNLNPRSLEVALRASVEPSLASAQVGERFQFERTGYFVLDRDSTGARRVFNRTIGLRDSWAKEQTKD